MLLMMPIMPQHLLTDLISIKRSHQSLTTIQVVGWPPTFSVSVLKLMVIRSWLDHRHLKHIMSREGNDGIIGYWRRNTITIITDCTVTRLIQGCGRSCLEDALEAFVIHIIKLFLWHFYSSLLFMLTYCRHRSVVESTSITLHEKIK